LRARSTLSRHGETFATAEEIRRLERQLSEDAFELRYAGAKRQLVAILLFQLHLDVDLVVDVLNLVDGDVLAGAFERLEIPKLVQALDAVFQCLGVEDVPLIQPQLTPNDVVVRRGVAGKDDPIDGVPRALSNLQRDVNVRIGRLR